jgi:parallel beta-helix repeat protein
MATQSKKTIPIAILATLLVLSFTVSSSTSLTFAQRDGSSGGNQAAAQNSEDGDNDSSTGISQSSSSSQSSECLSEGDTVGSCNNISVQANQNSNSDDEEDADAATTTPETAKASSVEDEKSTSVSAVPLSASVSCGEVITQSVSLTSNLDCKTDGLIIGADGITIDLNGHTISGPGVATSKVGIMLSDQDNVNINGPGIIENFQAGVLNTGGQDDKINAVTFTQNQIGSFNTGSANTGIQDNLFFGNNIGVASHSSTGSTVTTNLFKSNDLAGITFVNSAGNEVSFNTIQGSVSGLFFDGQSRDNVVNSNNILDNGGVDINNANGLPLNVNNNQFNDNNCNSSVPAGLCLGK